MLPILAPATCLFALMAPMPNPRTVDREVLAMGTRLQIHVEGPRAEAAAEGILAEIGRVEAACSTWRPDSAWSKLNAAGGCPVPMAPEWIQLLARAKGWSDRTQGAFDPVLMALLKAWGARAGGRVPPPRQLEEARAGSGAAHLELDPVAGTVRLRHRRAGIEEGAFLKGYALDNARNVAGELGNTRGWLDFGGQILAWGTALEVRIADPDFRRIPKVAIQLHNASMSTSGCSERGRHILDPRTGRPCEAWGTVSVVTASAFDADILSTALYVLGPEAGPEWADRHQVSALFLLKNGGLRTSSGFDALRPQILPGAHR